MAADVVVKAVMIGLVFAAGRYGPPRPSSLPPHGGDCAGRLAALGAANSLTDALSRLRGMSPEALALAQAVEIEWQLSADAMTREGVGERVASRFSGLRRQRDSA